MFPHFSIRDVIEFESCQALNFIHVTNLLPFKWILSTTGKFTCNIPHYCSLLALWKIEPSMSPLQATQSFAATSASFRIEGSRSSSPAMGEFYTCIWNPYTFVTIYSLYFHLWAFVCYLLLLLLFVKYFAIFYLLTFFCSTIQLKTCFFHLSDSRK